MHSYHLRILLAAIAVSGLFHSCDFLDAGDTVTNEVLINDSINIIEFNSMMDIILLQDTTNKALITCGENLQSDINILTENKTLYINNSIKYNFARDYERIKLELHLKEIPQLKIRKPVSIITIDTFKTNVFHLVDWGKYTNLNATINANICIIGVSSDNFGHFTIKGKSVNATFSNWGSAFIFTDSLKTQNCTIYQKSIGDTYVNAQSTLRVYIETTGKVYYYGNPLITKANSFSPAKLIHLGN